MPRGKAAGKGRHTPRRRGDEESADASAWLTTYGDAVTLLLAFFVMLFAMSSTDAAKFEQMAQSMRAAFVGSDGLLPEQTAIVGQGNPADTSPQAPPRPDLAPPEALAAPDLSRQLADEIHQVFEEQGLLDIAEVAVTPEGVAVRVRTDDVLFSTGSADVRPVARQVLSALAPSLRGIPNAVRVEGHTDDVPIHRTGYTNWNLSVDRAVAVLTLLADEHGIDPARLSAVGFGEFAPLVPNDGPANRTVNRRVEIIIETPPDQVAAGAEVLAPAPATTPGAPS